MASDLYIYIFFQDNVFVTVVTSIQYGALSATPKHRSNPMSLMVLDLEVESHHVSLNNEIKRVVSFTIK